ncbi:MAG: DUF1116 domain-containing protein [Mycobacterium sp.]
MMTHQANQESVDRMTAANPVLVDVRPAGEALPIDRHTILTSGAPLPWPAYTGGQRRAIIGAALFEGLAADAAEASARLADGEITVEPCHDHGMVGSVTGVCSWSMPVLVVRDRVSGTTGHCTVYEGPHRRRLTYGLYDDAVREQLLRIRDEIAPALGDAVRAVGGVRLRPLIRSALGMGDDLHSRTSAATLLLTRELRPALFDMDSPGRGRGLSDFLAMSDLFFLHVGMAAAKATADAAARVPGSSVVTAMAVSEHEFAIRISGLGGRWFRAPLPPLRAKLFDGHTPDELAFMGGESMIMETIGLGGMSAAAAFSLQDYSGGTPEQMIETTLAMYEITLAEHPEYAIPYLGFRGVPTGIDARAVVETGHTPSIHMGASHHDGGHIGAGLLLAPIAPFRDAVAALDVEVAPGDMATPQGEETRR